MKVPLLDLHAQYETLREEMRAAVDRVFEEQAFILGSEVAELEQELASYSKVRHAIGCANGSDALLLALMALGIGAGDEVITTPYSFFATASAIARLGARPVFVDINPQTYNIEVGKIEAAITERTRALIPVHLYGQCAEMQAIEELCARRGIQIIEDAAQAIGADEADGRRAGGMGAIGCFSFYPSKNLGAAGDAGMLTTNDDKLAESLRILRVHGGERRYYHKVIGLNSRLDALQAAVLRVKLPRLDEWSDARARNATRYTQLLTDAGLTEQVTPPFVRPGVRHIYHQYVIRADRRDALLEHLKQHGVGTDIYYPVPLHMQECFGYLGYAAGDLPEAERAARETLALPVYPELTAEQQEYVVDVIRGFYS
ncbi:MAG: DegT/DnrJ/EryC1/StrS family aminotransferase [Pyrinomonadaceae bacterium]|nr:DegT/DnrJ/EryC1/StrS family aminotransferase [Pyrinomonadaceae bacterium]